MRSTRTSTLVTALAVLSLALAVALLGGCARDPAERLVGQWQAPASANKPGNLSDLEINADKTFTHVGKNALGGKVTFMGVYQTGDSPDGPWVRLIYHDFPDRDITWYYQVDGDKLAVSALPANLKNGTALEFVRVR